MNKVSAHLDQREQTEGTLGPGVGTPGPARGIGRERWDQVSERLDQRGAEGGNAGTRCRNAVTSETQPEAEDTRHYNTSLMFPVTAEKWL